MKNNKANRSGLNSEAIVKCVLAILESKNYPVVSQHFFPAEKLRKSPIASKAIRVDFLVRCIPGYEAGLIIEIKRQDSSGSADQKLVYQIEKEIKEYYPYPAILVMVGIAWSSKWKKYAISQKDKWFIDVFFSYEDLLLWCESLPVADINNPKIYDGLKTPFQSSLFTLKD
ncbi:MAG: PD-(D/E)XK nuclease superfamily protein [Planctomycetota bacterium]